MIPRLACKSGAMGFTAWLFRDKSTLPSKPADNKGAAMIGPKAGGLRDRRSLRMRRTPRGSQSLPAAATEGRTLFSMVFVAAVDAPGPAGSG